MEVIHDYVNDEFYVKEKIDNQTFKMSFQIVEENPDSLYMNIALVIYNKRKHIDHLEANKIISGLNPFKSAIIAMKAFRMLEEEVLNHFKNYNIFIYCTWIDNRRRQVYEKFLTKQGYNYGTSPYGELCLFKKYPKERGNNND